MSSRPMRLGVRLFRLLLPILIFAGLAEACLRLFAAELLRPASDERALLYRHDPLLGWFPREDSKHRFSGAREIEVRHNSQGFRDREPPAQRARFTLAVLGDSFVWGYDAEYGERFTELLEQRHPDWDVRNLGVSGWGTDQSLLLWERERQRTAADALLLVFCTDNDRADNRSNVRYRGYFKPWFEIVEGRPEVRGQPVPESPHAWLARHPVSARSYLVRAMVAIWKLGIAPGSVRVQDPTEALVSRLASMSRERATVFVVALTSSDPELEMHLANESVPFLVLDGAERHLTHGAHWTVEGHARVATAVGNLVDRNRIR